MSFKIDKVKKFKTYKINVGVVYTPNLLAVAAPVSNLLTLAMFILVFKAAATASHLAVSL